LLQNRLGHEAWGSYAALSSFAIALTVLTDFGVNQYTIKSLASDLTRFKSWFPGLMGFKIVLMLIYPPVLYLLGYLMGYDSDALLYLMIIAFSLAALQLVQFLRSSFQAFQHFKLDGVASVLDKVLLSIFCVTFLWSGSRELGTFLGLTAASTGLSLLVFLVIIYKLYGAQGIDFNFQFIRRILKLSFPFALITVVYAVHDKIDKVMLEKISGPYENGLYSAASRWVDALMMYTWIVMGLYYARFAKFVKVPEELSRLLANGQLLGSLPMIPGFLVLYFKGYWLTSLLLPDSTASELETIHTYLIWLALATLINSSLVIYSTLLTATGHERPVTRMVVFSIVIKATLNFIFIPSYGGLAASIASLVSFAFLSFSYLYLTHKYSGIPTAMKDLLKLFGLLGVSFGGGWIVEFAGWEMLALPTSLLVFVIVGELMGFLRISRIKELLQ
jgi:O-antigen/teichoic acid export membrane protein